MFKLLVLTVLLCQGILVTSGEDVRDSTPKMNISNHFYGVHQIYYFNAKLPDTPTRKISEKYRIHRYRVTWDQARRRCLSDGGHLAIIKTREDLEALKDALIPVPSDKQDVWVGYHDRFGEGDWLSALDEPIDSMKWGNPWSMQIPNNPDNAEGDEDCAVFLYSHSGLNDDNCGKQFPFACQKDEE